MLEFDINKAVEITYSGATAAFIVLAFLIAFTLVISRVAYLRRRSTGMIGTATTDTSAEALAQVPLVASLDMSAIDLDDADEVKGASGMDDWKNYGRLEAFLARTLGRRSN